MLPNKAFLHQSPEFWANIKFLNQKIGYYKKTSGLIVPTMNQIVNVFNSFGLSPAIIIEGDSYTELGQKIDDYFRYRADILTNYVEPRLMDLARAKAHFDRLIKELNPKVLIPQNKQTGNKKAPAYLTGICHILIENGLKGLPFDYDPRELTGIIEDGKPKFILSRRVDGAFPSVINPIAILELKEYYYTTTFGSRIADGVYETQLDGWELKEIEHVTGKQIEHYLIVDDYNTWWNMGKSYLCRLVDTLHMGLVDEVIFGEEVLERMPIIVENWKSKFMELFPEYKASPLIRQSGIQKKKRDSTSAEPELPL